VARINVTKTFLPPIEEYVAYVEKIWESGQLTNQGPLLKEFETRVEEYLGVENLHFVTNGTIALQVALRALDITEGEVITTPFSYVATTSSVLWERCTPVFVDIEPNTFCIDADKIEAAITKDTKAIMAVHVFGFPCDVEKIAEIAERHNLKVIYDGAHAFGAQYKGKSLLSYSDITTCSFHATKIFQTIEGGAIIVRDKEVSEKVELIKRFGHTGDEHYSLGINAKASEFQAAMGLCVLPKVEEVIEKRKRVSEFYDMQLQGGTRWPKSGQGLKQNYGYYPVVLGSEDIVIKKLAALKEIDVFPRRYFYPSLNKLPYISTKQECPVSEDVSRRVLCLPLYPDLDSQTVEKICKVLNA
jgi:dTDP-4-amino-4,6-dideoxygalactose transaminase